MTNQTDSAPGKPALKKAFSIKVLGVGGAGCNAVNHLARESFAGVSFTVMNTDAASLAQSAVENKLVLGSKSTRGLGAGGDPERGRRAAEEDLAPIRALCDGADIVFVVAGLGGGTGTGASPIVARAAKEAGALVLGMVILPFDCEGRRRERQAQQGLEELKAVADGVITLPNQKVFSLIDEKTSLLEAFHITNELLAEAVRGIWRLLSRPALINVDFADLCAVIQDRHSESSLATAEARGEDRAQEVIEKLLSHPVMERGQVLQDASGVLVCITGGPELTMAEVNRIMEEINRHNEEAHLILGAAIDEALADRLVVTLVASRRDVPAEARNGGCAHAVTERAAKKEEPHLLSLPDRGLNEQLANPSRVSRPSSRFVAPPPEPTPAKTEQLLIQQAAGNPRQRKTAARLRQGQLPLEIISKGRFEKSEPTIYHGQDLDVPTYLRRGVALN